MAFVSKILGQANPGAVLTDLYTVPGRGQVTLTLSICNTSIFVETYRVSVVASAEADAIKQYLAYDTVVDANSSSTINNISLRAGDVIRVFASSSVIAFTAMGTEST